MKTMTTPQNNQPNFNSNESPDVPDFSGDALSDPSLANQSFPDQEVSSELTTPEDHTATDNTSVAHKTKVERSIAGSTWVALILGIILLILLLVFILQNQESAELQLFAWTMNFPIGVGMLIAAIVGALVMALVGGVRIMQLRRQVTRQQ